MKFSTAILMSSVLCVQAQFNAITNIIPADRLPAIGYWTPGVPGGIDQYSTNYSFFCNVKTAIPGTNLVAAGDGVTDDTVAIQTALNLCPANQYVFLPAGHYRTSNELDIITGRPVILRGAGPQNTFIENNSAANSIIHLASASGLYGWQRLTADARRGDKSLSVADASNYHFPFYLMVESLSPAIVTNVCVASAAQTPVALTRSAATYMIQQGASTTNDPLGIVCVAQWLYVTNIVGNTLYFDRPLNCDYTVANASTVLGFLGGYPYRSGVEDMTIIRESYPSYTANTHGIFFDGAFECWAKNVESVMTYKWHIQFNCGARNEARECYLHDTWSGGGDSGYGIGTFNRACDNLAIDNLFLHCRHSMVTEWGGQGNVWAYNYSKDPINGDMLPPNANTWTAEQIIAAQTNGLTFIMGDMIQHGGNPMYDLWEGNVGARLSFDYVLGGSHFLTAYRNWIQRQSINVTSGARAIEDMAYNYSNNIVGNILLVPGQTATVYDWQYPLAPSSGVWRWGYVADGDTSSNDTNCLATTIRHLNYDYWTESNQFAAGLTTNNLPASLFLASKPSVLSGYGWPVMGPDVAGETNSASSYPIPAMARFYDVSNKRLTSSGSSVPVTDSLQPPTQLKAGN